MTQEIPLVFCFDGNFTNYAAVATFSAFTNSKSKLKVHWIIPSEAENATIPVKELLIKWGLDITIHVASDQHFNGWKEQGHIKKAAYIRLLIPEIISAPKVIYLDCDLIVQADIVELFELEIGASVVAGAHDAIGEKYTLMPQISGDKYINSGVMVLNLESLRKNRFLETCTEIYNKFLAEVTFSDQCIINKYSEGQKTLIDPCWNYYFFIYDNLEVSPSNEPAEFQKAKILHFTGHIKPWSVNCPAHLGDRWWEYANRLNLPNLERKPYDNFMGKKIKRGIRRRIMDSVYKRILKIGQVAKRLYRE